LLFKLHGIGESYIVNVDLLVIVLYTLHIFL